MRDRYDDAVLYEENITTSGCQGFPRLALPHSPAQSINHFITTFWRCKVDRLLLPFLFYFPLCWGDGAYYSCFTFYILFSSFPSPTCSDGTCIRYFFSLFFFSFAHIYIWSLFLFHPILRYTLSRFLTLLVGDIGIGVGPANEGRWTLIPGFGRYLSLSLGWTGKGGTFVFFNIFFSFQKTFSFDTMINRREVFFFPLSR